LFTFLSQYQPSTTVPFIKQSTVLAQESNEQRHTILADGLPFKFQTLFPGYLSQHFSNWHKALDLATGLGMPIKPIAGGTVVSAGYDWFGYGLKVEIDHGNGYKSLYAHLGKIYVEKDQKIESNHYIGEVGLTGRTTGPHTHLEVQKDNQYIDPEIILPQIREYAVAEDFKPVGGYGFNNPTQPKQTPKPVIPDWALEPAVKKPESKDKNINTLNNFLNLTPKPVKADPQELAELLKINL
jgi:murein DD-endopeptidase MepM/ murein hydrolase activator NlpD